MSRSYNKNKYTGSKAFDKTCRCHGGCTSCKANREYQHKKQQPLEEALKELENETEDNILR